MKLERALRELFDGMQYVRRTSLLTAAAALALAGTASAQQNSIGLKLGQNGNGNQQGGDPAAMLPTDQAGAPGYAQVNWNVLGRYGDNPTNTFGTNAYAILDSGGNDTHITINWDATGTWSVANGGTPANQNTPDGNLMNAYDDSNGSAAVAMTNGVNIFGQSGNNKPMVYLQGIKAWLATQGASQYDVVLYMDGDSTGGRCGFYWMENVSGAYPALNYGSDMTTRTYLRDFQNFTANPVYQEVPQTSNQGRTAGSGNYTVFRGLSADAIVVRSDEFNSRSGINALQLVPRTTPVGPTVDPLLPCTTYVGGTASFRANVAGVLPFTFQWQTNGVNLVDGGGISGSTSTNLTITGVTAANQATYTVVVTSTNGTTTSSAPLTVTTVAAGTYAQKVVTNNAVAYWRFNDAGDPSTNFSVAADPVGGFNGTYGPLAQNGFNAIVGPRPPAFPGFESGNSALQTLASSTTPIPYPSSYVSWVVAPPLNLNTNTVTITAWIYPTAYAEPSSCALIFERGGSDVSGFGYGNNNNLGYTWNGAGNTFGFVSGLVPASNQWSFVALVVSPTNAILYLYNTNGQFSATNTVTHTNGLWANLTMIGDDPSSTSTPQNRAFTGDIDEVAVFNRSLSDQELYLYYKKGLNVGIIPASISTQPVPLALYVGRNASFTVAAAGDKPFTYQWRANGVPLVNSAHIAGANSATLWVTNVGTADAVSYDVVVDNVAHSPVTSVPVTLAVVTLPTPLTGYEATLQASNPLHYWRFNEASGSPYAYDYWGGNIATNDSATAGAEGPRPPDFPGFEANNSANSYDGFTSATETGLVGVNNNLTQFTIAGWFNSPGSEPLRVGLFGQNDVTEFGFHGQDPYSATGISQLGIYTPGGGAAYLSQTNITPNQWYFTAAVGDGNSINLYLITTNGSGGFQAVQATTVAPTTNYGASAYAFNIGGGGILDAASNYFTGTIDEVALWHRALSGSELSSLFAAGIGVTTLAPQITAQPADQTLYAGRTATFSVSAIGTAPLSYRWLKNNAAIADANAVGQNGAVLTITNLVAGNIGNYSVVITNSAGSVTSSIVALSVITPTGGAYESLMLSMNPLAYYRLNETADPSTGTTVANEYFGGHAGLYGAGASNGFNAVFGPRPPEFSFENTNFAAQVTTNVLSSWVTAPFGSLSTNTVTMCMWIKPTGTFDSYAGLLVNRNSGIAGGFGYTGGQLGYTWNNNSAATYNFASGLIPPLGIWSFVALTVSPTNAIVYMKNVNGELSATNVLAHTSDVFGNNWLIGRDDNANANDATRNFCGVIDEVAVFTRTLSGAELHQLYVTGTVGVPVTLSYQRSGNNIILTWPNGTLLQAPTPNGPWGAVPGNPNLTYTVTPNTAMQFYRVQVR